MNSKVYIITAKTNLHVGSGDSDFGMIGKQIQRDPLDNLPCINASSLKGALREYVEEALANKSAANLIFGNGMNKLDNISEEDKEKGDASNVQNAKGNHIFHESFLLSIPVRSNHERYFNATSPKVLKDFLENMELFDIKLNDDLTNAIKALSALSPTKGKPIIFLNQSGIKLEDFTAVFDATQVEIVKQLIGQRIALLEDSDFNELTSDYQLPLIARNNLENGQSKNLWYEQIIPRQSRFYATITDMGGGNQLEGLIDEKHIQIGANATIGYGLCHFKSLETA